MKSMAVNLCAGLGLLALRGRGILSLQLLLWLSCFPVHRSFCSWWLCLTMALVMAIASPVAATGHHGDSACLVELFAPEQTAPWGMAGAADVDEADASVASPCCLPCAQCAAAMASAPEGFIKLSVSLDELDHGSPVGAPAPFERPPRS